MKTPYERIQQMVDKLNFWTKAYDEGKPLVSDKEWDDLYFQLQLYENTHGIYFADSPTQKISYEVKNALTKVEHKHPMLSLQKTKDLDVVYNFTRKSPCLMMLKMDGLTCSLRYENGYLVSAETRGNGTIGEDILHNAKIIKNIPNKIRYQNTLVIDGEVICTYQNFEKFANEYKNPRNFASGSIRLLDSKECEDRGLSFIAWDIIEGLDEINHLADKLLTAQHFGFTIVPGLGVTNNEELDEKIECLKNLAKELGYPIDGLVFKYNDVEYGRSLGATEHHSNNAIAYKFYDEEYETKLLNIEWTMGRTGILTPVAIVEPVDTGDSIVERASLHNLTIMHTTLGEFPYCGQPVKLIKSNMIIPQIVWADKGLYLQDGLINIPVSCPICGELVSIVGDNDSQFVCCSNPMCQGQLINRLDHFCSKKGLDIRGLSKNTLEKLIDWGWVSTITDIFNLKNYADSWKKKPGFGEKSVDNILTAIENSKNCSFVNFVTALGIPLVGTATAKDLQKEFGSWTEFRNAVTQKFNFYSLDGFGIEMHYAISRFDYSEADVLAGEYLNIEVETASTTEATLDGLTIVITGKLNHFKNRGELQKLIEAAGGKVAGSVSKNTAYLINNDTESSSSKNLTAKKLGVKIISEEEFIQNYFTL